MYGDNYFVTLIGTLLQSKITKMINKIDQVKIDVS